MDGTCGNGAEEKKTTGQQGGKSFGCWNGCASGLGCGVDLVFGEQHGYVFSVLLVGRCTGWWSVGEEFVDDGGH